MATSFIITAARFAKGVIGTDPLLFDGRPQFVFVGRSNVGKSSVLSALLKPFETVQTSANPGKTQQLNAFLVNNKYYFIDFPGYGYAKVAQKRREKLRKMILWYFEASECRPKMVFLIIDAQVGITDFDRDMLAVCTENDHRVTIVANKMDKLTQKDRGALEKSIANEQKVTTVLFTSAKTGRGLREVLNVIGEYV